VRQVRFAGLTYVTPGPLSADRDVKDGGQLPVQTLSEGVQLEQSRDRNAEDRRVLARYD